MAFSWRREGRRSFSPNWGHRASRAVSRLNVGELNSECAGGRQHSFVQRKKTCVEALYDRQMNRVWSAQRQVEAAQEPSCYRDIQAFDIHALDRMRRPIIEF